MKILVTTEFYLPFQCGVTTAVENMMAALTATGDDVRVLTIAPVDRSYWDEGLRCWYIRATLPSLYKDSYSSLNTSDPVLEEVVQWRPDIIHSQTEFFSYRFALRLSRRLSIPIVHTCHTDFEAYSVHFTRFRRAWCRLAKLVVPLLIRKSSRIICSTDKIEKLILSYGVKTPIDRIPVGVDLEKYSQRLGDEEKKALRKELGIEDGESVISVICRLSREKNVAEVVRNFHSLLSRSEGSVRLLIAGEGEERKSLEALAAELGMEDKVIFTGFIPSRDVWKYHAISDIAAGASRSETQCLSYIEAMASGVPLLVLSDPVLSSYIKPGVNGSIYDGTDGFVSQAVFLLSSPGKRDAMGEEARLSALAFSLPRFASSLHECYSKALEDHCGK